MFATVNIAPGQEIDYLGTIVWTGATQAERPANQQSFWVPPDLEPLAQNGLECRVDGGMVVGIDEGGENWTYTSEWAFP